MCAPAALTTDFIIQAWLCKASQIYFSASYFEDPTLPNSKLVFSSFHNSPYLKELSVL